MNKKLFSWKALAGLTLLVAMGLSSCDQSNPVDPTDPNGTKIPTKPSVTPTGSADLTFTVTAGGDVATLWSSVAAETKTAIDKKSAITIAINNSGYKLDGTQIVLPAFFTAPNNKVVNIVFNNNFAEAKKALNIDASTNLSGATVNITLPAQAFDFTLDATNVAANLTSAGAAVIGTFTAKANTVDVKNATNVGAGVTVNGIIPTGYITKNGGDIKALSSAANVALVNKKGAQVGKGDLYVADIILTGDATVSGTDKDTKLNSVTIAEGKTLTFGEVKPFIGSIIGSGKGANVVATTAEQNPFTNIASLKNVSFDNTAMTAGTAGNEVTLADISYDTVTFADDVVLGSTSIANVTFKGAALVSVKANNTTVTFTKANFGGKIGVAGGLKVAQTPTKTTYQWDTASNIWVEVTAFAPISESNKSDEGIEVSSTDVSVTAGVLTDANNKVGAHKVFTIVKANEVTLQPENCVIDLTNSTIAGAAITDANISSIFSAPSDAWYTVKAGDVEYNWKKNSSGTYILVKK